MSDREIRKVAAQIAHEYAGARKSPSDAVAELSRQVELDPALRESLRRYDEKLRLIQRMTTLIGQEWPASVQRKPEPAGAC